MIVELGTKTAAFVKETLYKNTTPINDTDPNLSVDHIAGLADYITEDTILDVKVRNNIDEKCVRCGECITHYDGGCYMRRVLLPRGKGYSENDKR